MGSLLLGRTALVGLLLAICAGCASVPMASPQQDSQAKKFQAVPDKSVVYVYRNESFGAAVKMKLFVDGQQRAQTAAKTYARWELEPGTHTIKGKAENSSEVQLNTLAGRIYYLWQEVKLGLLSARNKLQLVGESEGQKGVNQSKLIEGSDI